MNRMKQCLAIVLANGVVLVSTPDAFAYQESPAAVQPQEQTPQVAAQQTPDQLQRLVAPIALYPDELVGQILAADTYPDQIVQADRWLQANIGLEGEQLGREVDAQPWDDSVKGLTEFPSVLANMDRNLSWASSLGDAYINQEQDVMNAVQALRQRAQRAGNLQSTSQQKVTQDGNTIVVAPADPQIVYLPQYDPWLAYGAPFVAWPGWYWQPGLFVRGPGIHFGLGFGLGFFGGFGWGFGHWHADWHHHHIIFNHNRYVSHSSAFVNRRYYAGRRNAPFNHGAAHDRGSVHGGGHRPPSTFGGYHHGGVSRGYSGRGRSSVGGHGGGPRGGGPRGGGSRGGGGRGGRR
jgi:hypothetical protein